MLIVSLTDQLHEISSLISFEKLNIHNFIFKVLSAVVVISVNGYGSNFALKRLLTLKALIKAAAADILIASYFFRENMAKHSIRSTSRRFK